MPVFKHIDAWIEVNDERVVEYDITLKDTAGEVPSVSCWIPSTANQAFTVHWSDSSLPRTAMKGALYADGTPIRTTVLFGSHGPFVNPSNETLIRTISTSDGPRKIKFADIELTDDDSVAGAQRHSTLGAIAMVITPVIVTSRNPEKQGSSIVKLNAGRIHERSKKAGVHTVQAGELTKTKFSHVSTRPLGPSLVAFIFRYRPLALLQANGIAPAPSPAPSPPPAVAPTLPPALSSHVQIKDEDEGEDDDAEEKIRRLQMEIDRIRNAKRRRSDSVQVKAEPSSRRIKVSGNNDVIDLTLDD